MCSNLKTLHYCPNRVLKVSHVHTTWLIDLLQNTLRNLIFSDTPCLLGYLVYVERSRICYMLVLAILHRRPTNRLPNVPVHLVDPEPLQLEQLLIDPPGQKVLMHAWLFVLLRNVPSETYNFQ